MTPSYCIDAERLKEARESAGLKLTELAARTEIDAYSLALIEQEAHVPTLTSLRRITCALAIPAYTVIEWLPARSSRRRSRSTGHSGG